MNDEAARRRRDMLFETARRRGEAARTPTRTILWVNLVNTGDADDQKERRANMLDSMRSLGCDVAYEVGFVRVIYVALPEDRSVKLDDIAAFPDVARVNFAQSRDMNDFQWIDA